MPALLTPPNRDRLVKLLGLLGSDQLGERAVAAAKVSELVKRCGASWSDLIGAPSAQTQPQPGPRAQPRPDDSADLGVCLRHVNELTDWEFGFCQSLCGRPRRSPKQLATLAGIASSLRARGFV